MSVRSAIGLRRIGVLKLVRSSKSQVAFLAFAPAQALPVAAVVVRKAQTSLPQYEPDEDADTEPNHGHGEAEPGQAAHGVARTQGEVGVRPTGQTVQFTEFPQKTYLAGWRASPTVSRLPARTLTCTVQYRLLYSGAGTDQHPPLRPELQRQLAVAGVRGGPQLHRHTVQLVALQCLHYRTLASACCS